MTDQMNENPVERIVIMNENQFQERKYHVRVMKTRR